MLRNLQYSIKSKKLLNMSQMIKLTYNYIKSVEYEELSSGIVLLLQFILIPNISSTLQYFHLKQFNLKLEVHFKNRNVFLTFRVYVV